MAIKKAQIIEVARICNGKVPGCTKEGCYYICRNGRPGPCLHTKERKYARHPKLNPKIRPDRFDKFVLDGDDGVRYVRYYERVDRI